MELEVFTGEVEWFGPQYGFIKWSRDGIEQKDMFVHFSDISMKGYRQLKAGQKVSFSIGKNHSGQPKAIEVQIIEG